VGGEGPEGGAREGKRVTQTHKMALRSTLQEKKSKRKQARATGGGTRGCEYQRTVGTVTWIKGFTGRLVGWGGCGTLMNK